MITIAITIDEDVLSRVDRLAARGEKNRSNRSRFIREAVREHLIHLERASAEAEEDAIIRRQKTRLARQARALIREQAR